MSFKNLILGAVTVGGMLWGANAILTSPGEKPIYQPEQTVSYTNKEAGAYRYRGGYYPLADHVDTVVETRNPGIFQLFGKDEIEFTYKPESDSSYTERTGIRRTTQAHSPSPITHYGKYETHAVPKIEHQYEPIIDINNPESYENVKNSIKRLMYHCEPAAVNRYDDIGYSIYKGLTYDRFADTLRFSDDIKPIIKEYALKAYKEIKHLH